MQAACNMLMSMIVLQSGASLCWYSKIVTDFFSSTVRGRSLKSVLTTLEASTGSATNCSVNWQWTIATSWSLTCSRVATPATGTLPSTVRLEYYPRQTTTGCRWVGTRVTPAEMHSALTTEWCSARMTATTTCHQETAQRASAADSGTRIAITVVWMLATMGPHGALLGRICLEAGICRPLVCGCSVNRYSSQWTYCRASADWSSSALPINLNFLLSRRTS